MLQNNSKPAKLVEYIRDGLVEQEHFGFILGKNFHIGESFEYPFYLRSCAKPLQGSLIIDYNLNFTLEEIAICCASHAGEACHVNIAKKLLDKVGFDETFLKCGFHKPISKTEKEILIKSGLDENIFHNNCVGKHIMMLALCKKNGWNLKTYDKIENPLQKKIKNKIYNLCELSKDYPVTKDGCGVPIHAMPLKNMLSGYLNLFCSEEYTRIKEAYLQNPYIIGGEDRLDTKIMQNSSDLIAKVGAGGLCIVVNIKENDGFIVKISDCDMKAREAVVLCMLKKMNWADIEFDNTIKTLHGEQVGIIQATFFPEPKLQE